MVLYLKRIAAIHLQLWQRKGRCLFLALFWYLGLLCGSFYAAVSSFFTMHSIMHGAITIGTHIAAAILPFLLSAFAIYISVPALVLPICFVKSFLIAFVSMEILHSFGAAGWVYCVLILFGNYAVLPFLYWYWLRHYSKMRPFSVKEFILLLFVVVLIALVSIYVILPLAVEFVHL